MRTCVLKVLLTAVISASTFIAASQEISWGEEMEGFQLGVWFQKPTFRLGEPVIATVVLKNVTDQTRFVQTWRQQPSWAYELVITRDRNTRLEPKPPAIRSGSFWSLGVAPAESVTNEVQIDSQFDLATPGEYVVTVMRSVAPLGLSQQQWPSPTNYFQVRSGNALIRVVNESAALAKDSTNKLKQGSPSGTTKTGSRSIEMASPSELRENEAIDKKAPAVAETALENVLPVRNKMVLGIVAALLALVLAILWRAARRKSGA